MSSLKFLQGEPAISQFLIAVFLFVFVVVVVVIDYKELKIAQTTAQINQLFQLLYLISIYGDVFYGLTRMLMSKNENNDASKDRFA